MRFDLLPVVAYTWRRKGSPLRIPTPGKNARLAVCGAYRWPQGPFVFSHSPKSVNTATFIAMVNQLGRRARQTGKQIVLVLDNGSAHTSKRSTKVLQELEVLVKVFWLPAYSSEQLNDIEGLWKRIKEDHFCRMLVRRRERFGPAARALLERLRSPGALRRMLRPRHPCRNLVKAA